MSPTIIDLDRYLDLDEDGIEILSLDVVSALVEMLRDDQIVESSRRKERADRSEEETRYHRAYRRLKDREKVLRVVALQSQPHPDLASFQAMIASALDSKLAPLEKNIDSIAAGGPSSENVRRALPGPEDKNWKRPGETREQLAAKEHHRVADGADEIFFKALQESKKVAKLVHNADQIPDSIKNELDDAFRKVETGLTEGMEFCSSEARIAWVAAIKGYSVANRFKGDPLVETEEDEKRLKNAIKEEEACKTLEKKTFGKGGGGGRGRGGKGAKKCYKCGKLSHTQFECRSGGPSPWAWNPSPGMQGGWNQPYAPQNPGKGGGKGW